MDEYETYLLLFAGGKMLTNIAIYGRSGCGKSTIAHYLSQRYGYSNTNAGAACRKICMLLFNSEKKILLNRVGDAMREIDEHVWIRTALANILTGQPIVYDSMHFDSDYHFFLKKSFFLLKVTAPFEVRMARLHNRGQEFDALLDEHHRAEEELENYPFDYHIDNVSSDVSRLYQEIDRLISLISKINSNS